MSLRDDLQAIRDAPDQQTRNQAILDWFTDATRFLEHLERELLQRGVLWNPRRLSQLQDEDD